MKKVFVKSMEGIGDHLYLRPFLKVLTEEYKVYTTTFLPELYADIPGVHILNPKDFHDRGTTYRTQIEQFNNSEFEYQKNPPKSFDRTFDPHYGEADVKTYSIVSTFYRKLDLPFHKELVWDLPNFASKLDMKKFVIPWDRKIAIVRPATVRKEWEVHTRNPHPNYIAWCARVLQENGYFVISIVNLKPGIEWTPDGLVPPADLYLHSGELGIFGTLELLKRASVVVGGPGFVTPAAVSANVPLFTIFGGRMAYDTPYKIFHTSMNLNKLGYAVPDNPCMCTETVHNCNKKITHIETKFMEFLTRTQ